MKDRHAVTERNLGSEGPSTRHSCLRGGGGCPCSGQGGRGRFVSPGSQPSASKACLVARSRAFSGDPQCQGVGASRDSAIGRLRGLDQRVHACVHGGEKRSVCTTRAGRAPVRVPLRKGPAPRDKNTAEDWEPGAEEHQLGEPGGLAGPGSRPCAQRANAEPQHTQDTKEAAQVSTQPGRRVSPWDQHTPRKAGRQTNKQNEHRQALSLARSPRSMENYRAGWVLRGTERAWPVTDEPMGPGGARGGGTRCRAPIGQPALQYADVRGHVSGAGTTSCWRPARGGEGGASAPSGWSGGRGVLVS